jgi:serine/threonine-protein kinase
LEPVRTLDRGGEQPYRGGQDDSAVTIDTQVQVGSDFLGYRIEELIGRGGMGVVYRAYDLRLKRTVALKLVAPDLALDERFRARFVRETELAMALEHPNVVPVHDAGDLDDRLYLAMRLVEGTDLRALLRAEGPLEPARALAICRQVAAALDAAHARGLVHRDVKPSNVLLDADEHVYLADFGLSRLVADGSPQLDGRSVGTPAYFAPEQLDGEQVDGRADLYSLACLLFECLAGGPPFPHASRLAVAWAHLEQEPPSASERNAALPGAVDDVLRKGLAKDPADRQPTCAALIAGTETALGLRAPRRSRRRTALIGAGAVVLAGLAAVVTAVVSGTDRGAAEPVLYGRPGTVVRIDPATNALVDVVAVGTEPEAVAVRGGRVWVYNYSDGTVATVDERAKRIQSTAVLASPLDVSAYAGPVLAADASGAWFIGLNQVDRPVLVRITGTGRRTLYHLDRVPRGVAVGYGAVWVVAHGDRDSQLLRIDPATGKITHRTRFAAAAIDSVAVGLGSVWVVGASSSTLHRIDPRTGKLSGRVRVGGSARAPRPYLMRGLVWVGLTVLDPRTLGTVRELSCCPADAGEDTGGFGSVWSSDAPTGSVVRWGSDWEVEQTVRVVAVAPSFGGGCLTSIAAGAGGIWVTVASAFDDSCGR